jgi:hypothetical protein
LNRRIALSLAVVFLCLPIGAQEAPADWIAASNQYTNQLIAIEMKHTPELGSNEGLSQFDTEVSQPTLADEDRERQETEAVLATFKSAVGQQKRKEVAQDLQIIIRAVELQFRQLDFNRAHRVDFLNASQTVFRGLRVLLDEQTPTERRPAAVVRIRKYAGLEPGYKPLAEILKQRVMEQMAKPGVVYPARIQIETELGRNSNYIEGIATLLEKYKLTGWQEPYKTLKSQLADYDAWTKANVLPKARSDFRLPPEEYALDLEDYGIDIPPGQLAAMAHQMFTELQAEMKPIAEQIAKERHLPSSDYRDVIRELKKQQLVGDAILPFYQDRLANRKGHCRETDRHAARPSGANSNCDCGRDRAAASAAHGASAVSAQYRRKRRVCFAAEYSRRAGPDQLGEIRRLHLRCGSLDTHGARGSSRT